MSHYGERAAELFSQGFNCAQAVFLTFSDKLGMDRQLAARLTNCLGGGFVGSGGLCGAVSGACLALSARYGRQDSSREGESLARQKATYRLINQLLADFSEEFGGVDCRDLVERGLAASGDKQNDRFLCPLYVRRAAELAGRSFEDPPPLEASLERKEE